MRTLLFPSRSSFQRLQPLSRQPKLRMVASSAARSVMFRNTTSATASTPSATVAPAAM